MHRMTWHTPGKYSRSNTREKGIMDIEEDIPDSASTLTRRKQSDVYESFKRKSTRTLLSMSDVELSLFQYHNNEVFQPKTKAYK